MEENENGQPLLEGLAAADGLGNGLNFGQDGHAGVGRWVKDVLVTPGEDLHTALMRGNITPEQVSPAIQMLERDRRYKMRRARASARATVAVDGKRPRVKQGIEMDDMSSGAAVVAWLSMLTPAVGGRARGEAKDAFIGQTHRTQPEGMMEKLRRRNNGSDFA